MNIQNSGRGVVIQVGLFHQQYGKTSQTQRSEGIWTLELAEQSTVPEKYENVSTLPAAGHPNILVFLGHRCVQVKLRDDRHADGQILPRVSSHFARWPWIRPVLFNAQK